MTSVSHGCEPSDKAEAQAESGGRERPTPTRPMFLSLSLLPPGERATSWKAVTLGRNYFVWIRVPFIPTGVSSSESRPTRPIPASPRWWMGIEKLPPRGNNVPPTQFPVTIS
ncbi:hypothetical protein LX32DRAFT_312596 [Colletotrichum zoysiae]|uniref:Uncharacterized protein n=1 Tax=Colletotrichum zoysiae TaxID=1216348 RepID=A0AAD9M6G1_9PEZI|nr:hypothetical protein LX32DRAFT_312596 [Colletotrichum zoysiae]